MKWYNPLSWFRREYRKQEKTNEELAREQTRADFREAVKGLRKVLAIPTTHRANGAGYYDMCGSDCHGCELGSK